MADLSSFLKETFFTTREELEVIDRYFRKEHLAKGDHFLKAGRLCEKLAFMETGMLRLYLEAGDKKVTQWIATEGYFMTDLSSFIFQTPARWNMQALADCELKVIDRAAYHELLKALPKWAEIDRLVVAKCSAMMEDRIFSHLFMTAEERYHQLFERQPDLFNRVPLQYLASMLGMTPETLSRLRKKIQA